MCTDINPWLFGIGGFLLGSVVAPLIKDLILKSYENYLDEKSRKRQGKDDLKAQISLFLDQWNDREIIIPLVNSFRKDLIENVFAIRENLRLLPHDISRSKTNELIEITSNFLSVANRDPSQNNDWCSVHEEELDTICNKFEKFLNSLY